MTRFRVGGTVVASDWEFAAAPTPTSAPADLVFTVTDGSFTPGFVGDGPTDWMVCGRVDDDEVLRFPSVGDARVAADRVEVTLARPDAAHRVERVFFAVLFPFWLARRGWLCLHGAAVAADGEAVAFLGPNGAGKTSAALALADRGWRFLTDDLVVVDPDGLVHPTFGQVRLRPGHAAARFGPDHRLPVAHPDTDKLRAPAPPMAPGPVPLSRLFVMVGDPDSRPRPSTGAEAVLHLMFNSVPRELWDRPELRPRWLRRLARLAAEAEVLRAGRRTHPLG